MAAHAHSFENRACEIVLPSIAYLCYLINGSLAYQSARATSPRTNRRPHPHLLWQVDVHPVGPSPCYPSLTERHCERVREKPRQPEAPWLTNPWLTNPSFERPCPHPWPGMTLGRLLTPPLALAPPLAKSDSPGSTLRPQLLTPGSTLRPQLVMGMYRPVRTARPGRAPLSERRPHRGARCLPRRVALSQAAHPTRPPALGGAVPHVALYRAAQRVRHDALASGANRDALPHSATLWMSWSPPSRPLGSWHWPWAWLLGLRPPPPPVPLAERRGERIPSLPWEGL